MIMILIIQLMMNFYRLNMDIKLVIVTLMERNGERLGVEFMIQLFGKKEISKQIYHYRRMDLIVKILLECRV